jgi:pimeloyl-ACP methyl ester carboxylesterase
MSTKSNPTTLSHVLDGERHEFHEDSTGTVSYYVQRPEPDAEEADQRPLLLIHSINAAASAHEVRPLYDAYAAHRPVYAIDLPGYGFSERSDREYVPRLMVDAIHALIDRIRAEHDKQPIDGLAVSLSSEFLARAARESPDTLRSLALVSSTGFSRGTPPHGRPESNRGRPWLYRALSAPGFGKALFKGLTTPASIRFFLKKTFGSKQIDEQLFEDSCRMARHPGAHHAPFHFLSGFLFSADIRRVFRELEHPTWLTHGVRGDFTDFSGAEALSDRPNWRVTVFQTGALPYFEVPRQFVRAYEDFLADVEAGRPVNPDASDAAAAPDGG